MALCAKIRERKAKSSRSFFAGHFLRLVFISLVQLAPLICSHLILYFCPTLVSLVACSLDSFSGFGPLAPSYCSSTFGIRKKKSLPPPFRNLWMYNVIGRGDKRRAVQAGIAAVIFNLRLIGLFSDTFLHSTLTLPLALVRPKRPSSQLRRIADLLLLSRGEMNYHEILIQTIMYCGTFQA